MQFRWERPIERDEFQAAKEVLSLLPWICLFEIIEDEDISNSHAWTVNFAECACRRIENQFLQFWCQWWNLNKRFSSHLIIFWSYFEWSKYYQVWTLRFRTRLWPLDNSAADWPLVECPQICNLKMSWQGYHPQRRQQMELNQRGNSEGFAWTLLASVV